MQTVEIKIDKKKHTFKVPTTCDELTPEQYLNVVRCIMLADTYDVKYLLCSGFFPKKVLQQIGAIGIHTLYGKEKHFLTSDFETSKNLLPTITTSAGKLHGYNANFSNVTWEEFIFADSYFLANKGVEFCSVLYRQEIAEPDVEKELRVPFTQEGANYRCKLLADVPPETITAVMLNYRMLRERYIVKYFKQIFKKSTIEKKSKKGSFSWLYLHRMLVRNNLGESAAIMKLPCKEVLTAINENIKESLKRKK